MASLQNAQIDQSYQGLIKTADNTSTIPFPPQMLQFGDGTTFPIQIADLSGFGAGTQIALKSGTNEIAVDATGWVINSGGTLNAGAGTVTFNNGTYNFGDAGPATSVDFSNATVTGLPSGAAGLENGTGTNSLQSAAALTTTAADAAGNGSIAVGDGASATRQESVAIGQGALANGSGSEGSIAIGHGSVASANRGIAIGINGTTNSSEGIVIGDDVDISGSDRSIGIGGSITLSGGSDKVAIGTSASVSGQRGLAFGQNASATANEAIAIGYNVTAANAQTLSVKALETQTDSTPTAGGIIMSDAGGTDRRINIDASGALQIDSTPVGGGATPGLVLGTGSATDEGAPLSMASGSAVTTVAAQARGGGDIAIGDGAITPVGGAQYPTDCIAIGHDATVTNEKAMAFGKNARAQGNKSYAAGYFSLASASNSTAIGKDAEASATSSSALGDNATATATGSVALGHNITASTANTATVNLLQIAGYAGMNYADDAAAATGGIPLGGVYHTSGALKIRIA